MFIFMTVNDMFIVRIIVTIDLLGCGSKRLCRSYIIRGPRAVKQLPLAAFPLLVAQRLRQCWPRTLVGLAVEIVSLLAIELLLLLKNLLHVPRVFKRTTPKATFGVVAAFAAPQLLRGAWLRATLWVGRADGKDKSPLHLCFFRG